MAEYVALPEYSRELLERVERETGHPLQIREKDLLAFDSELQVKRPGEERHSLDYRTEYREFRTHFIVNACYKILRMWAVPDEERVVAASARGGVLPRAEHAELLRKLPPAVAGDSGHMMSEILFSGLVRQLTSFPVDLRVEREIAMDIPDHHLLQAQYLSRQVEDFLPTLDEGMLVYFPQRVYRASTAMNLVFAQEAAALAGVNPPGYLQKHGSREIAERLWGTLRSMSGTGPLGDRQLTDAWAEELGLEGWYSWVKWLG